MNEYQLLENEMDAIKNSTTADFSQRIEVIEEVLVTLRIIAKLPEKIEQEKFLRGRKFANIWGLSRRTFNLSIASYHALLYGFYNANQALERSIFENFITAYSLWINDVAFNEEWICFMASESFDKKAWKKFNPLSLMENMSIFPDKATIKSNYYHGLSKYTHSTLQSANIDLTYSKISADSGLEALLAWNFGHLVLLTKSGKEYFTKFPNLNKRINEIGDKILNVLNNKLPFTKF
ncbi:MAG: hypothetical protein Q7S22_04720 [Candidatus Micrarchaeota archaeon]|nr:hypothetical protein [Candidatus Micrarchaeota archaeon]